MSAGLPALRSAARGPCEFFAQPIIQADSLPAFDQLPVPLSVAMALAYRAMNLRLNGTLTVTDTTTGDVLSTIVLDDWDIVTQLFAGNTEGDPIPSICESQIVGQGAVIQYFQADSLGDAGDWSIELQMQPGAPPALQGGQLFLPGYPTILLQFSWGGGNLVWSLNDPYGFGPSPAGLTLFPIAGKPGAAQNLYFFFDPASITLAGNVILSGDSAAGFFGWNGKFDTGTGAPL
jgi:hypothetical protein